MHDIEPSIYKGKTVFQLPAIVRGIDQTRINMPQFSVVRAGRAESYSQALIRRQKQYQPEKPRNGLVPYGLRPETLVIQRTAYGTSENIRSQFPNRQNGLTWRSALE